MRLAAVAGEYRVRWDGTDLIVLPNVYAPGFFTDSFWFASKLPGIVGNSTLLEIGTGTGIISISCAKTGARVVATDINSSAVRNAQINSDRLGLNISVREGDVYKPINKAEKFDYIFWAHPFNNWSTPVDDMLLRSGMDYRYESLREYISGARDHLTPSGKLLLGTGDSADLKTIKLIARENDFRLRVVVETQMLLEEEATSQITYMLIEFVSTKCCDVE
tara:strand:- start:239 stop:898 length:660 start_codon:yes stop_codon:yes gene_type:complete